MNMGVKITELLEPQPIRFRDLKGKIIAIDAYNHLYQFLSSIRSASGEVLTNSQGNVTSHLVGLFSRSVRMMQAGMRLVYIFDGKPPLLKQATIEKRRERKEYAKRAYEQAEEVADTEAMRKFAARTTSITPQMVDDAKKMLELLGIPFFTAPAEAEAQAAKLVINKDAYAVSSQDADTLLFGTERLIRNLSISRQRRRNKGIYQQKIDIQLITLTKVLQKLQLSQDKLIALAMLVGTDYAPGVSGFGPKKSYKLVKKHESLPTIFKEAGWDDYNTHSWEEVFTLIKEMPVTDNYILKWNPVQRKELMTFLHDEKEFSKERIQHALAELEKTTMKERGLSEYFS